MENNGNDRIPTLEDLMKNEAFKKVYKRNETFFEGFRIGYRFGRNDAAAEFKESDAYQKGFKDGQEDGYDEGWGDGYDVGMDAAVTSFLEGEEYFCEAIDAEKPSNEESLLDFLDGLSLAEQRAAIVHLATKWQTRDQDENNEQ